MSNVIGIVNYGIAGNIHSIKKAIEAADGITIVINEVSQFSDVDKIVLPGVGSFKDAMQELENDGFLEALKNIVKNKASCQHRVKKIAGKSLLTKILADFLGSYFIC